MAPACTHIPIELFAPRPNGFLPISEIRKPQAEALRTRMQRGEGFQRENRRDPTLSFLLISKVFLVIARDRRPCDHRDSCRISLSPSMKIPGWTFGTLGGPIVSQVTLGSFSAPPVAGGPGNAPRLTFPPLGPPPRPKLPPRAPPDSRARIRE